MNDENKKVAVSDLGLASLLITFHFDLVGMERVNEKRVNFLFVRAEGINDVISDYWAGAEVSVPTQLLFQNQHQLKNRLYAFK